MNIYQAVRALLHKACVIGSAVANKVLIPAVLSVLLLVLLKLLFVFILFVLFFIVSLDGIKI